MKFRSYGPSDPEDCFYFIALVFTQQAVIYEYAGQLVSDCFGKHNSCYGGIDSAGQCAEDFSVAYFFSRIALMDSSTKESMCQSPAQRQTLYKVGKHFLSFLVCRTSGWNYGLHRGFFSTFATAATGQSSVWAMISNPGAAFGDVVVVAHPADGFSDTFSNSAELVSTVTLNFFHILTGATSTFPPSRCIISCDP